MCDCVVLLGTRRDNYWEPSQESQLSRPLEIWKLPNLARSTAMTSSGNCRAAERNPGQSDHHRRALSLPFYQHHHSSALCLSVSSVWTYQITSHLILSYLSHVLARCAIDLATEWHYYLLIDPTCAQRTSTPTSLEQAKCRKLPSLANKAEFGPNLQALKYVPRHPPFTVPPNRVPRPSLPIY